MKIKKKMWYIYIYRERPQYYSASKKKENLTFATIWVNFKSIMLREISQTQKDKYCMISLCVESEIVKLIEADNRMMGIKEMWRCWLKATKFQLARELEMYHTVYYFEMTVMYCILKICLEDRPYVFLSQLIINDNKVS